VTGNDRYSTRYMAYRDEQSRQYVPVRQLQHMPLIDSRYLARRFAGPRFNQAT